MFIPISYHLPPLRVPTILIFIVIIFTCFLIVYNTQMHIHRQFCPLKFFGCLLNLSYCTVSLFHCFFSLWFIYWRTQAFCLVKFPIVWSLLFSYSLCSVACSSVLGSSWKLAPGFWGFTGLSFIPLGKTIGCVVFFHQESYNVWLILFLWYY